MVINIKLIVGLGNPGKIYEQTRHNIGFMFIDFLLNTLGIELNKNKFDGLYIETVIEGEKTIILKPMKYINLSGEVIKKFVDYFKINIDDILVISDDLDMPVGKCKFKPTGRSGGHNGLKNIESCLGTQDYKRFKIGIDNDKQINAKNYVLSKIDDDSLKIYDIIFSQAANIIKDFIRLPFNQVMTIYNKGVFYDDKKV